MYKKENKTSLSIYKKKVSRVLQLFTKYLQKNVHSTTVFSLLLLLHPSLHLLKIQIALNDRLPARTRMELRELV